MTNEQRDDGSSRSDRTERWIPGLLIRRAQQVQNAVWAEHFGSTLTSPQYAVLASLHRAPAMDQVSITQLAFLDRSTLADVLARLDSRGLITRIRDANDARRNLVSLTPKGRKLLEEVAPLAEAVNRDLVECFSPEEREQFLHSLVRFVKHGEARTFERENGRTETPSGPRLTDRSA